MKNSFFSTHPTSQYYNRVLNWSETKVKNYYDAPLPKQSSRFTPLLAQLAHAGRSRLETLGGRFYRADLENTSIDSINVPEFHRVDVDDSVPTAVLHVRA